MSIEKVKDYLKKFGFENRIIELKESSATVLEAAKALDCSSGEIAKSLTFKVFDRIVMVVVDGEHKIDNAKFKSEFNVKPTMLKFDEVEAEVGHAVGGVCPFAVNQNVEIYLDESLKLHDKIFPACGNSHSAICLSIPELELLSNYKKWVDVSKI